MRLAAKNAISMSVTNAPLAKLPEASLGDKFKILLFDTTVKQMEVLLKLKGLVNDATQEFVVYYAKIDELFGEICGL